MKDVQFRINGTPGHGLVLLPETAGEKATRLMTKLMSFRESQVKRLSEDPKLLIGDVTTVNLTKMSGGDEFFLNFSLNFFLIFYINNLRCSK